MIRDFNIEWLVQRKVLLAQAFQTYVTGAGVAAGDPVFQEIGTTGISGIQIAAAGDMVATIWDPADVDIRKKMRFRVIYTQSSTTVTDTVDWIVTYTPLILEATVIIAPVTALSTAITLADASSGVANTIQASDWGTLNAATLADTVRLVSLNVEADGIGTYSANEVSMLGLEIEYTPRLTAGTRRNILGGRRLNETRPLGVQLATTGQEGASV